MKSVIFIIMLSQNCTLALKKRSIAKLQQCNYQLPIKFVKGLPNYK